MNTDVVLRGAKRRIIIDCKFHHEALAGRFERDTLISANLYQIFTYVKNQRHAAGWEKCEGLLLLSRRGRRLRRGTTTWTETASGLRQ